ncbi:hypothetical protein [Brevundimonas lutea]|uniref:hypothetical protein n=1 Tax=Brevundimonas lutea TaxID=2293980 RepID=UPI000F02B851|nr:hypothetical protein [Brevundimonas lutea]
MNRAEAEEPPRRAYLAHTDADAEIVFPATRTCVLAPGLHLVVSALDRSRLHHRIKRQLPADAALLVAPLAEAPKFRNMSRGVLKFTRAVWPPRSE